MKKIILTLAFGLFFIAFSNAQSTESKTEYSVEKSKTTTTASPSCHAKAGSKASCAGKSKACCAGKSKTSCSGKAKASCSGKAKATKETL